jgi:hypothetical protein
MMTLTALAGLQDQGTLIFLEFVEKIKPQLSFKVMGARVIDGFSNIKV